MGDLERDRLLDVREAVGGTVEVDSNAPLGKVNRLDYRLV